MSADPRPTQPFAAAFGESFQSGWRRLLDADQHDIPLERLAAYADGRLSDEESRGVARELAESPAALEILSALMDDAAAVRTLPSHEIISVPELQPAARPPRPASGERRRMHVAAWAAAACFLVAAWGVISNRSLTNQVVQLKRRVDEAGSTIVVTEKERLAELTAGESSAYLAGSTSPQLAQMAVMSFGQAWTGNETRGGSEIDDEQARLVAGAQDRLALAASALDLASASAQLEHAAALLQAGRLDEAQQLIDDLDARIEAGSPSRAQWENLKGVMLATLAAETPVSEAANLWSDAEAHFRRAAELGLRDAWLNLARLLIEQDEYSRAQDAAEEYLRGETDPQLAELLRGFLEQ